MENKELINLIDDVFSAVDYVLNELDEDEVYSLEEMISMYDPFLWYKVISNRVQYAVGKRFFKAVHCGKFSPLRMVGKIKNSMVYQLSDC